MNDDVDASDSMTKVRTGPKLKLTFEEYKNLSNLLILRIRQEDERRGRNFVSFQRILEKLFSRFPDFLEASDDDSGAGVRRSELVGWYLQQAEDEIETEDELMHKKSLAEKVIDRLVKHVKNFRFEI